MFTTTASILKALKTELESLPFVDSSERLFQAVEIYDAPDLLEAIQDLHLYDDRVCLVVASDEQAQSLSQDDSSSRYEIIERIQRINLVMADRAFSDGTAGLIGDETKENSLGVIGLKDRTIELITGKNLNLSYVSLIPDGGGPHNSWDEKRNSERKAWIARFRTSTGIQKVPRRGAF